MKVIKRYANRKLYDTETSTYVTLQDIAGMVREEIEFTIIDNRSKADITSLTLAQILCEQEKRQTPFLPLQALRTLIQSGEDFFDRRVRGPLYEMRDKTQGRVERIIRRAEDGEPVRAGEGEEVSEEEARSRAAEVKVAVQTFIEGLQRNVDDSLHSVEEQVRRLVEGMSRIPDLKTDIARLKDMISELERRVMELEATVASQTAPEDELSR